MAYTITYSPEKKEKYPLLSDQRKKRRRAVALLCALAVLLAISLSPLGADLRQAIQTDSMRIAEDAATVFSEQLTAGESLYDALLAYCRHVLENANG